MFSNMVIPSDSLPLSDKPFEPKALLQDKTSKGINHYLIS